jgi:threonine/homoserine/homoserine lactone efflux protein
MYAKAKVTNDKQGGDRAVAIILACIAAVGLLFLVSMLACSLACNGSDAAAVAVMVLGTAAIVFGLIAVIRGTRRKKVPEADSEKTNRPL